MSETRITTPKLALPPLAMRADVAAAIRQAVRDETRSSGTYKCQLDTLAASAVATALTGFEYHPAMVKTRLIFCSVNWGGRWYEFLNNLRREGMGVPADATEPYEIQHCFAFAGEDGPNKRIVLDVGAWQLRNYFKDKHGVNFDYSPAYCWCWERELPTEAFYWYQHLVANDDTPLLYEHMPRLLGTVEPIVHRALDLLAEKGYQRPAVESFPPWFVDTPREQPSPPEKLRDVDGGQSAGKTPSDSEWLGIGPRSYGEGFVARDYRWLLVPGRQ